MNRSRPMDTSDLTGSVKVFAERLEPRLQAGAKTFQGLKLIVAALTPLVLATFGFAVWSVSLAKKAALDALEQTETARHAEMEKRVAVIETQRNADSASTSKALESIVSHLQHMDDVLLDLRIRLGAQTPPTGKRGR